MTEDKVAREGELVPSSERRQESNKEPLRSRRHEDSAPLTRPRETDPEALDPRAVGEVFAGFSRGWIRNVITVRNLRAATEVVHEETRFFLALKDHALAANVLRAKNFANILRADDLRYENALREEEAKAEHDQLKRDHEKARLLAEKAEFEARERRARGQQPGGEGLQALEAELQSALEEAVLRARFDRLMEIQKLHTIFKSSQEAVDAFNELREELLQGREEHEISEEELVRLKNLEEAFAKLLKGF